MCMAVQVDKPTDFGSEEANVMKQEILVAVGEARLFTLEHGKRLRHDLAEEFKEELVAVRQQCEGRTQVAESEVDGCPCPEVADTGAVKIVVGEKVVAAQDLPLSDWQLCGVTGHCTTSRGPVMFTITVGGVEEKQPAFVANMEEPCLVGLDSLVQSAACVDFRRMEMQVCEEMLLLIPEDAAEQVESPMTSSDVEDERLELHYRVMREGEVADATVRARERQAAVVKMEKRLMDHEGVFSRDAQDLVCTLLVQPSNMAES
ncbi:hypothetical protein E2C01_055289 [Portunus trituberculatus]|uniref:Uncharacterized protein n=1 Tax=Portunus trituberculatus TaxID=210409 RepID=A0A5B7GUB2_PORTR|nr:hypothetical protein [Portunus trituberculatus]